MHAPIKLPPQGNLSSIPQLLSLRIMRIWTSPEKMDIQLQELKQLLLARDYPETLIDSSIKKTRKVPRKVALFKVRKKAPKIV